MAAGRHRNPLDETPEVGPRTAWGFVGTGSPRRAELSARLRWPCPLPKPSRTHGQAAGQPGGQGAGG